jgi:hypothetical protein
VTEARHVFVNFDCHLTEFRNSIFGGKKMAGKEEKTEIIVPPSSAFS